MRQLSRLSASPMRATLALLSLLAFLGCGKGSSKVNPTLIYQRVNLVSDKAGYIDSAGAARKIDPKLINPWGITSSPTGPLWVANNGSGVSTIYDGTGSSTTAPVTIPPPTGKTSTAKPTGVAYNGTTDFVVTSGNTSGAAQFIFVTEDGTISGWNPTVNPTQAILVADRSVTPGSVFKGAVIASSGGSNFLYVTDFKQGVVEVFDKTFNQVNTFADSTVPAGFAPFGIALINGNLYVSFAKQDANKLHDVAGAGNGYIDVFTPAGNLVSHLVSGGALNSPWGMALAPSTFGTDSNDLLVGNFGDGTINVYDPNSGGSHGPLLDGSSQNALTIPGLWGLWFGNGSGGGASNTLYFTAGINAGADGLFGAVQAIVKH